MASPYMRIGPIYIWKILREGRDSAFPAFHGRSRAATTFRYRKRPTRRMHFERALKKILQKGESRGINGVRRNYGYKH